MNEYNEDEPYIIDTKDIPKENKKKKAYKNIAQIIFFLSLFLCFYYLIPKYVAESFPVKGSSMENTLFDKDIVFVEKLSLNMTAIKRFDVIVFNDYYKDIDNFYIKRVIGLPGEVIQIVNGIIYINNQPLIEEYGKNAITYSGIATEAMAIGKNEYFVLGDNREISFDSRYEDIGMVSKNQIVGRAFIKIWPINRLGLIK